MQVSPKRNLQVCMTSFWRWVAALAPRGIEASRLRWLLWRIAALGAERDGGVAAAVVAWWIAALGAERD